MSRGSFTSQDFSFDNNIFYDSVVNATWGAYGIFCFYNQNTAAEFKVSITNNQFHQSTFAQNTFFNVNYAYNLSPMYLTIKENIITGSCGSIYGNLGDFAPNAPGYISGNMNWDVADNYQAANYGDAGIAPRSLMTPRLTVSLLQTALSRSTPHTTTTRQRPLKTPTLP